MQLVLPLKTMVGGGIQGCQTETLRIRSDSALFTRGRLRLYLFKDTMSQWRLIGSNCVPFVHCSQYTCLRLRAIWVWFVA